MYKIDKTLPLIFENTLVYLTTGDATKIFNEQYEVDQYSLEQYEVAVNNVKFLNQALKEADALGEEEIVFPKEQIITLCYNSLINTNLASLKNIGSFVGSRGLIFPYSNTKINLNSCTLKIIFDSNLTTNDDRYNYSKTLGTIGYIFCMTNVSNISIINGTLVGDIFQRAFTNILEKNNEQTVGVRIQAHCHNIKLKNLTITGFMGDGIHCTSMYPIDGNSRITVGDNSTISGIYNNDGSVSFSNSDFYSSIIVVDKNKLKALSPSLPTTVRLTESFWGYNFLVFSKSPKILFLNDNNSFHSSIFVDFQTPFQIPNNISKLVVQFYNTTYEYLHTTSSRYIIREIQQSNIQIDKCIITNNHRGGIAPMCEDFKITNCFIFNNGRDSGIDAPIFPDSTRYGINCEDSYPYRGVIKDNVIQGTHTGIIMYGNNIKMENNEFIDCYVAGIVTYINQDVKINNNRFINSGHYSGAVSIAGNNSKYSNYVISNNSFKSCSYFIEDISANKTNTIIAINNIGDDIKYARLNGNIIFNSNIVEVERLLTDDKVRLINSEFNSKVLNINSANLSLIKSTNDGSSNIVLKNQYYSIDYTNSRVVIKGLKFINCQPKEILPLGDNFTIEYIDCEFIDTMIQAGCGIKSDYKRNYKTVFKNCRVKITQNYNSSYFIFCPLRTPTANIQIPEFEFYNCDIHIDSSMIQTITYDYYNIVLNFNLSISNIDLNTLL